MNAEMMPFMSLSQGNYPQWYLDERDTDKTIKKLTSIKQLDYYLSHPDRFIRRLAIIRAHDFKSEDCIRGMRNVLDDGDEYRENKELAAWVIKSACYSLGTELFNNDPLLAKYYGFEKFEDLWGLGAAGTKASLETDFSKSAIEGELLSDADYQRHFINVDLDEKLPLYQWMSSFLKSISNRLKKAAFAVPRILATAGMSAVKGMRIGCVMLFSGIRRLAAGIAGVAAKKIREAQEARDAGKAYEARMKLKVPFNAVTGNNRIVRIARNDRHAGSAGNPEKTIAACAIAERGIDLQSAIANALGMQTVQVSAGEASINMKAVANDSIFVPSAQPLFDVYTRRLTDQKSIVYKKLCKEYKREYFKPWWQTGLVKYTGEALKSLLRAVIVLFKFVLKRILPVIALFAVLYCFAAYTVPGQNILQRYIGTHAPKLDVVCLSVKNAYESAIPFIEEFIGDVSEIFSKGEKADLPRAAEGGIDKVPGPGNDDDTENTSNTENAGNAVKTQDNGIYTTDSQVSGRMFEVIANSGLNLRESPDINAKMVLNKVMAYGTRLTFLLMESTDSQGRLWYFVKMENGQIGWVYSKWLKVI